MIYTARVEKVDIPFKNKFNTIYSFIHYYKNSGISFTKT
ncbi:hypothetical protein bcere0020_50780 [Bacillus cereus Rock3-29]|nr:hypothetical protein bcere0020_50780 [Bacillus cereus Rock3-29]